MAELGELMAHLDPIAKWWSKQPFVSADVLFACKLELVDMLHFYMSIWLCERDGRMDIAMEPTSEAGFTDEFVAVYESGQFTNEEVFGPQWFDRCKRARRRFEEHVAPKHFVELLMVFGVGAKEIVQLYAAKNALNRLRQANGYGKGTYIKNWFEGREDTWALRELPTYEAGSVEELIEMIQAGLQEKYDAWRAVV